VPDIEGFDFVIIDVQKTLDDLRWKEDMAVTNPFGEEVWLKPLIVNGERIGITDCCFVSDPCPRHAAQHSVNPTVLCTCETIDTQVTKLLDNACPVHGSHSG
jgi:hypothetical protein